MNWFCNINSMSETGRLVYLMNVNGHIDNILLLLTQKINEHFYIGERKRILLFLFIHFICKSSYSIWHEILESHLGNAYILTKQWFLPNEKFFHILLNGMMAVIITGCIFNPQLVKYNNHFHKINSLLHKNI